MSEEPTETTEQEVSQEDKLQTIFLQGKLTKEDYRVVMQMMQQMTKTKWAMMAFIVCGLMGFGGFQFFTGEGQTKFIGVFFMAFAVIIPTWFYFQIKYGTTAGYDRLSEDVLQINCVLRHDGLVLNTPNGANKIVWSNCGYIRERDGHALVVLKRAKRFVHFHERYAQNPEAWQQTLRLLKDNMKVLD